MLKRLSLALAGLFAFVGVAGAAGTIPFSLSQQFDEHGKPLSGCRLYTIQAGTVSTPQNAYQDEALSIALPNPMVCDAAGRLPQFFLADGSIKVRLTDKDGVTQVVADGILVIGPSGGGGGGGGGVDPSTVFSTGDVLWAETSGTRSGWVRDNGRTIGSATSGATERANSDTEALFNWLWQHFDDSRCPVAGGRGVSSAADWAANKTIQLPDKRGYVVGGLDDMGNSAAGRYASAPIVGSATAAGSVAGSNTVTLLTANLPPYTPAGAITNGAITTTISPGNIVWNSGGGSQIGGGAFANLTNLTATSTQATSTFTGTAQGGTSTPANTVQGTVLGTFYRKL